MFKATILALFLIAVVSTHPGHGNHLNQEQKTAWTAALEAKTAHLAAQRKFHTSELDRYTNRDEQYAAMKEAWGKDEPMGTKCLNEINIFKQYLTKERAIDKYVTVNQKARNPLLAKTNATLKKALATKQAKKSKWGRNLKATEDSVSTAYMKWFNEAKKANTDEQAFHHVEFKEFEGQEACGKEAEERMANPETLDADMAYYYKECMNKVKKDVKKAVVDVADNQRKVSRKDLSKFWKSFTQDCQALRKSDMLAENAAKKAEREKAKADKQAAKKNKGNRRSLGRAKVPMTQAQKDAWEKAFSLKDIHQAAQRKFHTSEFERYKARTIMHKAVNAVATGDQDDKEKFKAILKIVNGNRGIEKKLDKTINANKAARNAPNKAYKQAMGAAARGRSLGTEDCAAGCTAAFEKWYNTSKSANDAETKFHTVEFQEFDRDDECTKTARATLAGGEDVDQRAFAKETMGCYRAVQTEVKRPVVNKADGERKKERSPIRAEWKDYVAKGRSCFMGRRGGKKDKKVLRRNLFAKYQTAVRDLKAYVDQA